MSFNVHFKTYQKAISMFLVISFLVIPLTFLTLPKKAEATCVPFTPPLLPAPTSVPVHDDSLSATKQTDHAMQTTNWFKNCILDGLATMIAKTIIQALTKSIVKWINSGFKGNPSFVQNPGKFFAGIADKVAGNVIENIAPFLCSPFRLNIQLALALSATSPGDNISCTLTDVEKNFSDFLGNSSIGVSVDFNTNAANYWDNWYNITQNPQNNPYGAMMIAQAQMTTSVGSAQAKYQQQLDWGRGFLSFEECPNLGPTRTAGGASEVIPGTPKSETPIYSIANPSNSKSVQGNANGNSLASIGSLGLLDSVFGDGTDKNALAATGVTGNGVVTGPNSYTITNPGTGQSQQFNRVNGLGQANSQYFIGTNGSSNVYDASGQTVYGVQAGDNGCLTKTPGAVIESQLENTLGSDLRGLEIAQSIDQIVAALVGQLVSQALGGIGGLMSAGKGGSSGGGGGFNFNSLSAAGVSSASIPNLPITGSCMPSSQTAKIGDVVTWDAIVPDINGNVTYAWYGDGGLTGNHSSATTTYTSNGDKTASVLVTTSGTNPQSVQIDCIPDIQVGDVSTSGTSLAPTISCAASPSVVSASNPTPVTWQAVVTGGTPPFAYSWLGDDGLTGNGQTTIKTYTTASTTPKAAVVQVTDANGNTYSNICYGAVMVTP